MQLEWQGVFINPSQKFYTLPDLVLAALQLQATGKKKEIAPHKHSRHINNKLINFTK